MDTKDLVKTLCQGSIPSRVSLYYRKEINSIYSDCFNKARYFKKAGLFPKTKDNYFLMETALELKNLQLNYKSAIKKETFPLVRKFLSKAGIEWGLKDNHITLNQDNQIKLNTHFKKLNAQQLSFDYSFSR